MKKWCFASGCHTDPVPGHSTSKLTDCASCHGGNGSCDPNSSGSTKKDHQKTLDCMASGCHLTLHSYTTNSDCVACHFASAGIADCPW